MTKKQSFLLILLLASLGILVIVLIFFRFQEDTWICQNNQWVKHGNPSQPMPNSGCGISGKNLNSQINTNVSSDSRCQAWDTNSNSNSVCHMEVPPGYYFDTKLKQCVYYPGTSSGCSLTPFSTIEECQLLCEKAKSNSNSSVDPGLIQD